MLSSQTKTLHSRVNKGHILSLPRSFTQDNISHMADRKIKTIW